MINFLKEYFAKRGRNSELEKLCASKFKEVYPGRKLIGWFQILEENEHYIYVRLCYSRGRPPGRTFWKVEKSDGGYGTVLDITDSDEGSRLARKQIWR